MEYLLLIVLPLFAIAVLLDLYLLNRGLRKQADEEEGEP